MTPTDRELLMRLETQAREIEAKGNHVEALEYWEDIDRRGWSKGPHLLALGRCYLNVRQRQDAKRSLIRAWEADPGNAECRDLLDKNFPGWERRVAKSPATPEPAGSPAQPGQSVGAPPPPDDTGGGTTVNLTVETITPPVHEPAPPRPAPKPVYAPRESTGALRPSPAKAQPAAPAARAVAATESSTHLPTINWEYVMHDAIAEGGQPARALG